jgi:branched-chain amino acid transport system permease protein
LTREFADFRYLFYGAALVVMMLVRPGGLWPEAIYERELRKEESELELASVSAVYQVSEEAL